MKIAHVVINLKVLAGGNRIIIEQANRLLARGHEVELWSFTPVPRLTAFIGDVPVIFIPNKYNFEKQQVIEMYPERVSQLNPEVLVIGSYPLLPPLNYKSSARIFWYLQHDEVYACFSDQTIETYKASLLRPVNLLSNSKWTQQVLRERYGRDSRLIQCGIDTNIFSPSRTPLYHFSGPSLLFFYNNEEWKGSSDLLNALGIVFEQMPHLQIIAVSSMIPKHFFAARNLIVHLQPRQEDLRHIFASATIAVSSSWSEGFGLPGLEAMACGTPLVTTDSGGVREYAVHEENCLMVPPKDQRALAEAILRLLGDEVLRERFMQEGIKKAAEFDWEKRIDLLEKVLKEV